MNNLTSRSLTFLAGGVAAIAVAAGGTAFALDGSTAPDEQVVVESAAPANAGVTYLIECVEDNLVSEPATFTLACGDGNAYLDALEWSDWGADSATATGELVVEDQGVTERYEATVEAGDLVLGEASATYGEITVTLDEAHPGFEKVETYPLLTVEPSGDLSSDE